MMKQHAAVACALTGEELHGQAVDPDDHDVYAAGQSRLPAPGLPFDPSPFRFGAPEITAVDAGGRLFVAS